MGARFSASVQTGPRAYPASCTMGTGSFPGVKRPGRGADHLPPPKRQGHERVELYLYSPSGPSWPVLGRTLLLLYLPPVIVSMCTLEDFPYKISPVSAVSLISLLPRCTALLLSLFFW